MRLGVGLLALLAVLACAVVALGRSAPVHAACSSSYVQGMIGGATKCLHAGEFCSPAHEADYQRYGFSCVDGRLRSGGATAPAGGPARVAVGRTVTLGARVRATGCRRGALPDRRCSPGAYYSDLTQPVICAAGFHTGAIRNVPQSEKFAVEREYGMAASYYGRAIEIDHLVPLELGGSNAIANIFPEPGSGPLSYHAKDRLENRLHDLVCAGTVSLAAARTAIAANWVHEYRFVFGLTP